MHILKKVMIEIHICIIEKSINVYYTSKLHPVSCSSEMPEFAYIYHFSQKNSVQMQKTAEACVFFAAPLRFPLFYAIIVR